MAKAGKKKGSKHSNSVKLKADEYNRFITWTATPKEYRDEDEKEQKDFALKYHLDVSTLSLWKRDPAFWSAVNSRYSEIVDRCVSDVRHTLQQIAKTGENVQAIKLFLQYEKQWSEKIVTEHQGKVELSPEDTLTMAEQIMDAKEKK